MIHFIGYGGGTIKRKWIVTVLVLFGLALLINVSDVSAATNESTNTTLSSSSGSVSGTGATEVSPKVTFTNSQISDAASRVKTFQETNNRLPNYVSISTTKVTMPQFLQLLTDSLLQVNSGSTASITLKNVNCPLSSNENVATGTLTKSEYVTLAQQIKTSIDTSGKAPASISTSLGTMNFQNLVYSYSKIMTFYRTNNRLPTTVSVKSLSATTITEGTTSLTADQIFKTAAKFGYSSAAHDAAGIIKYGSGDCWAMSDYLYKQLTAAGIKARILQYATAYSSNHRSVQYMKNGAWVNVPYTQYGFNMMFNSTSGAAYGTIIAQS